MHHTPTLIIGGGIAGASLACSMAERGAGQGVALVDVDLYGKFSSSELNGGGVRCTFAEPVNIRLSLQSLRYYQQHAEKFDFRQRGYLWMYDHSLWQEAHDFLPTVRSFGLPVEELSLQQLKRRFPVLGDVSDLAGATFTPADGRLSPHRLRIHYLDHAQAGGVFFMDRWHVIAIEAEAPPYTVVLRRVKPAGIKRVLTRGVNGSTNSRAKSESSEETLTLKADRIVNAAGPWAAQVASLYGRDLPIKPHPRQVFLLRHPQVNLEPEPFFIDYPQDIYFRHYERDGEPLTLVSWSDPAEPDRIDFSYHDHDYYNRHVKPRLARRIPQMNEAQIVGGWVGHYELSPDKLAVVGEVPGRPGICNYNGLSAHGVMQSRALGECLAGWLIESCWPPELDLSGLTEARFEQGRILQEKMYV